MLTAPNLSEFEWVVHGFGQRDSVYPAGIETVKQIHSGIVLEAPVAGGEGDALVSNRLGTVVGIKTADCVPVLIVDGRTHAVAAIHAGWRGTAVNIVSNAVRELFTRYRSRPEDLHAAIGPSIRQCCYEVSGDVAHRFATWVDGTTQPGAPRLDLPGINERQLRDAGVRDIWKAGECTFCLGERYFSFRREKEAAGRMLSFIGTKSVGRNSGEAETA